MKLSTRGFTLVELMIVIAIIGILAAALFPSMTAYLKRSRDAARVSGTKDITTAVGAFFADKERYPDAGSGTLAGCANAADLTTNYLPKGLPKDPQSTNSNGCDTKGEYGYGSGTTTNASPGFVVAAIFENANGGNTGITNIWTGGILGNGKTFGAISTNLTKGAGAGYVLTN